MSFDFISPDNKEFYMLGSTFFYKEELEVLGCRWSKVHGHWIIKDCPKDSFKYKEIQRLGFKLRPLYELS